MQTPNQQPYSQQNPPRYAGIHLSGPNAPKTALVILTGGREHLPFKIWKVYEKIGSFGRLFSDERLVDIIGAEGPMREVFVDCPLSVPPCVACTLPQCPGVSRCDDVSVAYMLALGDKGPRGRSTRPVNPQSQRLWDIYTDFQRTRAGKDRWEASYSSNMAPLVIRARTLQKRFSAFDGQLLLKETSVEGALEQFAPLLRMSMSEIQGYRQFVRGRECRERVLKAMIEAGWLENPKTELREKVVTNIEVFKALITSWVAILYSLNLTQTPPTDYLPEEGWVHLPNLSTDANHQRPQW